MPLSRDYLEGMIAPPVVIPENAGLKNVRVDQQLYRQAQKMIGLTDAESLAIGADVQVVPVAHEMTTPPSEVDAKNAELLEAVHDAGSGKAVATIVVTPNAFSKAVAGTQQLVATLYDEDGQPTTGVVAWTTSDATKATVSASGLVTGVAVGTPTITATVGSVTGTSAATITA